VKENETSTQGTPGPRLSFPPDSQFLIPDPGAFHSSSKKGDNQSKSVELEVEDMKKTREQRQQELETKAKEMIQELLDWTDQTERPNLTQMEDEILALREKLSQAMLESMIQAQDSTQPVEGGSCPSCGRPLRPKGSRAVQLTSRVGEVTLERVYAYCPDCQSGIFPPGSTAGTQGSALE
jgi:RNA polymerase-binding transcription factor DksA